MDAPTLGAGSGAVVFADHIGIGGSLAFNGQDAITRAYTQDTTLVTPNVVIDADANDEVITLSRGRQRRRTGRSRSPAPSTCMASATRRGGARRAHHRGDARRANLDLHADSTLRGLSAAGAASQLGTGIGAFGAALDLGTLGNAAYAYIGDEALGEPAGRRRGARRHARGDPLGRRRDRGADERTRQPPVPQQRHGDAVLGGDAGHRRRRRRNADERRRARRHRRRRRPRSRHRGVRSVQPALSQRRQRQLRRRARRRRPVRRGRRGGARSRSTSRCRTSNRRR